MKKQILEKYKIKGSIHTMQMIITAKDENYEFVEDIKPCLNKIEIRPDKRVKVIVNPNHLCGDIFDIDDLKCALELILQGCNAENYEITRVDMRFDSYEPTHYETYKKLYRYLILLMMMTYPSVKNHYKTDDLLRLDQLSVAIKNQDFEVEHYDRAAKSRVTQNSTELAQSRFEIRAKHHNASKKWQIDDLEEIFCENWLKRWEKAIKKRIDVQNRYNQILTDRFFKYKDTKPAMFRNVNEFLRQYQEYIFTRDQTIDLLESIGVQKPTVTVRNFKARSGIEYISKRDVNYVIEKIKQETRRFFSQK